jgi:hypothetical protein
MSLTDAGAVENREGDFDWRCEVSSHRWKQVIRTTRFTGIIELALFQFLAMKK